MDSHGQRECGLGPLLGSFPGALPNVPVHIETISGFNREIPFLTEEFMSQFEDMNAGTLSDT